MIKVNLKLKRSENCIYNMKILNNILINVKYLECIRGKTMSGETVAFSYISKINENLKWKNRFVTPIFRWLLCNALIQPLLDYVCFTWYLKITKKTKTKLIRKDERSFCLQLDKMVHKSYKKFVTGNWLPMTERFNQCLEFLQLSVSSCFFFNDFFF